jgi:hypothetical protein
MTTSPRAAFPELAREAFGFLIEQGLPLASVNEDLLVFASERRFVHVFYARFSYNVGVEVGRWIDVDGTLIEQEFPIGYVLAAQSGATELERIRTAIDRAQLQKELYRLAGLLGDCLGPLLADDEIFVQMAELQRMLSRRYTEGIRASTLRVRAIEAWSRKDFARVASSYREIVQELPTSPLRPSEWARLRYAESHLDRPPGDIGVESPEMAPGPSGVMTEQSSGQLTATTTSSTDPETDQTH